MTLAVRPSTVVTPQAKMMAKEIGLLGNADLRLRRMARRSARVTHPSGNRRFYDFILQVEDNKVLAVDRL